MKRIRTICVLLSAVAVFASCLSSSNNDVTLYDDAVITAFSLGNVNKYDSVGTKTIFSGSAYTFHIDQVKREIFNTDSLPVGSDASKILCSITTRNSGVILIKSLISDSLFYYNSTDSIDFSQPREFWIYPTDGTGYTRYKVSVNVHQQNANDFVWQQATAAAAAEAAATIEPAMPDIVLPAGIKQLLGRSTKEIYALSDDNTLMVSVDSGATWTEDLIDESGAMLPVQDLAVLSYPMNYADSTDYVVLVGNRSVDTYPQESVAMVWRKIVDYSSNAPQNCWTYIDRDGSDLYMLPRMQNMALARYDDSILAIGGAGIGGAVVTPWSTIYQSRDNGITWKESTLFTMPAGFDTTATQVSFFSDTDNFLWLVSNGTNEVWRARLNRLGWEE